MRKLIKKKVIVGREERGVHNPGTMEVMCEKGVYISKLDHTPAGRKGELTIKKGMYSLFPISAAPERGV